MPRSLIALIVVVLLLLVGLFMLSGRSTEQELSQIEAPVSLDNLAK